MNILIVDDLHEVFLEKLDQAKIPYNYQPDITREEAEQLIPEYEGLVIRSKFQVDADFIDLGSRLKLIGRAGAGMDNIDEAYAGSKGIALFSANDGNKDAVGEHMIGMLLSLMNNFRDRKSTRLNSSHVKISYAVFCLKKKKAQYDRQQRTT